FIEDHGESNTEESTASAYKKHIIENIRLKEVHPRTGLQLDVELNIAMKKMMLAREIFEQLPGIDCGACGSPNCLALAEDIVQGKGQIFDCVFIQKVLVSEGKITPEASLKIIGDKWGKERFKKSRS
ncbi:MAG: ferredoxin, partial [Bacteroidales bacterium]|nr:ferredoxin [Bacteroidales bacterium]